MPQVAHTTAAEPAAHRTTVEEVALAVMVGHTERKRHMRGIALVQREHRLDGSHPFAALLVAADKTWVRTLAHSAVTVDTLSPHTEVISDVVCIEFSRSPGINTCRVGLRLRFVNRGGRHHLRGYSGAARLSCGQ